MGVFDELKRRGMIAQMTHEDEIRRLLNEGGVTFYIGFDPTADSLHVGHFLQLMVMARMQQAGHRPIAILGAGTAMVGDPTGKTDMRRMMTIETIMHNAECFKRQMAGLVDFENSELNVNDNPCPPLLKGGCRRSDRGDSLADVRHNQPKALMINNADWLMNLNYVDFLREVGVHFSVNRMLTAECFKSRLEKGLSFIEFNYMLM